MKRLASLLALAALAGCAGAGDRGAGPTGKTVPGQKDEENAVRFVMADLQAAGRDGDGDRICDRIFTPKLADSVTAASESGSCAKEVRKKLFSPRTRFTVEDVEVADPANATATVRERSGTSSKVLLARQSGEWRVRSVQPG